MQTIENSLLQVSVNENGAQVAHIISLNDHFDYLKGVDRQENMVVAFLAAAHQDNLALKLPWTVVDKGDSRVSLTLIDTAESYKKTPYHFEVILTYYLEGNQLTGSFYLKNNSNKEMPFSLSLNLPLSTIWSHEQDVNKILLQGPNAHQVEIASNDFKFAFTDNQIHCVSNDVVLAKEASQTFKINFILK